MAKDAVIILSGGMDSCTMLHEYRDEIAMAITFDYGSTQNHREQQYAVKQCQALGTYKALNNKWCFATPVLLQAV